MRCAVLLMTHPGIGQALLETVNHLLDGRLPLSVEVIELDWQDTPSDLLPATLERACALDQGKGVLVLTDLYGASPSNLAAQLLLQLPCAQRVAGVNLPMLLRVLNYPDLALDALASVAADAARTGAIVNDA